MHVEAELASVLTMASMMKRTCQNIRYPREFLNAATLEPKVFFLAFGELLLIVVRGKREVVRQQAFAPKDAPIAGEVFSTLAFAATLSEVEKLVWSCRTEYYEMMTRLAKGFDSPGARFEMNPVPKVVPVEDTILMTDPQIVETGQALVDHFTVALQFLQKVQDFVSPPYVDPLPDTLLDSRVTLLRRVDDELASGGS